MRKGPLYLKKLHTILLNEKGDPIEVLQTKFLTASEVPKSCTRKFYELLEKNGCLEEGVILECMSHIASTNSRNVRDYEFWKNVPWIRDIQYDNTTKMYTIVSNKGSYSFLPVQEMYPYEYQMLKKHGEEMDKEDKKKVDEDSYDSSYTNFDYKCHYIAYEHAKLHQEDYAVTAVCPNFFSGSYWLHSYNISYNNAFVTDYANGVVMPVEDFENLLCPIILDKTKGDDIPMVLEQIKESKWVFYNTTIHTPLKTLAFYHVDQLQEKEFNELFGNSNRYFI